MRMVFKYRDFFKKQISFRSFAKLVIVINNDVTLSGAKSLSSYFKIRPHIPLKINNRSVLARRAVGGP